MPRFKCVNGHRGPVRDLVLRMNAAPHTDDTVPKVCPDCGANVVKMPCNKHAGQKTTSQRSGGSILRKPFSVGTVSVR